MKKQMYKISYILICIYIFIVPVIPYNLTIKNKGSVADLLLLIIFLTFFAALLQKRVSVKDIIRCMFSDIFLISMLCLTIVMAFSVLYAKEKSLALSETLRFFSYFVLIIMLKLNYGEEKYFKKIKLCYFSSVFVTCLIGIIQAVTGLGLEHKYYYVFNGIKMERIASTFENPNSFAAFLVMSIFPVIMFAIKEKAKLLKIMYSVLVVLILCSIVLTGSRNAFVGVGIGLLTLTIIYSIKLLIPIGILGVAAYFIPRISSRIKDIGNSTLDAARLKLWKTAIKMIKDHPVFGVGNGNYVSYYDEYVKKYPELSYADFSRYPVHNSYLKVETELGIPGGITFAAVIITLLMKIYNTLKYSESFVKKTFYTGFFASAVAFLFMNFSDNLLFVPKIAVFFWIFIGLCDR
ncbi:O-antigen ligase [Clostridium sp. JN-9]|uniref:O-antigen ligase family protein n=1 Tax=Clostridium sp. JN-9 TaxID=2507159 RepID=UPI000FFE001B|nr:O-antigen ligase [Clostridium sp. JN-9]QAT40910.1 O-antigen ligase family protein [Clostridium sp. JN-9]